MKRIRVKRGDERIWALVDDEDYDKVCHYRWFLICGYARTKILKKTTSMQCLIFKTEKNIDHINGNRLDNRRKNLREATTSENGANRKVNSGHKTSKFKGVYFDAHTTGRWKVTITKHKKQIFIGRFDTEAAAARAYNRAAIEYFGEFARLNKVPRDEKKKT